MPCISFGPTAISDGVLSETLTVSDALSITSFPVSVPDDRFHLDVFVTEMGDYESDGYRDRD